MPSRLAFYSTVILAAFVIFSVTATFISLVPPGVLYSGYLLANVSGFLALFLIAASGIMMVFRNSLLRRLRDPDLVRSIHLWLAALGGGFLVVHVVFLILLPVTLPVFYGYVGTYASSVIWITGILFLKGLRSSLFYHSLLSLIGISLIVVHVVSAGKDVPLLISGISLVVIGTVVLGSAIIQVAKLSRPPARSRRR